MKKLLQLTIISYLFSIYALAQPIAKIDASTISNQVFSNGKDWILLTVKLYDENGNLLTNVNTNLLTSSNDEIIVNSFEKQNDFYTAHVTTTSNQQNLEFSLNYQQSISSNIISIKPYKAPLRDKILDLNHAFYDERMVEELNDVYYAKKENTRDGFFEKFSINNSGPNKIFSSSLYNEGGRTFNFEFLDHATQNISLSITDRATHTNSEFMNSLLMFFPRKYLPQINEISTNSYQVLLPTGEIMQFNRDTNEIIGGVLSEGPVDTKNTSKLKRHFADLKYHGKGIIIRANARNIPPELGQPEQNIIDKDFGLYGSKNVLIINGTTNQRCIRPKIDFWDNKDSGGPTLFKFPTDEEFNIYLQKNCNFSIPQI